MASLNKVILIGHLGADPDLRYLPDGTPVASASLATTETWKDKTTGERKEQTEWHRIALFRGLADIAGRYLRKGSQVYVEGRLRTRKWTDPSGADRTTTEIVVNELLTLGQKPEAASAETGPAAPRAPVAVRLDAAATRAGGRRRGFRQGRYSVCPTRRPGRAGLSLRRRVMPWRAKRRAAGRPIRRATRWTRRAHAASRPRVGFDPASVGAGQGIVPSGGWWPFRLPLRGGGGFASIAAGVQYFLLGKKRGRHVHRYRLRKRASRHSSGDPPATRHRARLPTRLFPGGQYHPGRAETARPAEPCRGRLRNAGLHPARPTAPGRFRCGPGDAGCGG